MGFYLSEFAVAFGAIAELHRRLAHSRRRASYATVGNEFLDAFSDAATEPAKDSGSFLDPTIVDDDPIKSVSPSSTDAKSPSDYNDTDVATRSETPLKPSLEWLGKFPNALIDDEVGPSPIVSLKETESDASEEALTTKPAASTAKRALGSLTSIETQAQLGQAGVESPDSKNLSNESVSMSPQFMETTHADSSPKPDEPEFVGIT